MSDVEQLLVSRVIYDGDVTTVLDSGIKEDYFVQPRWLEAWKWIYKYWTEHSMAPPLAAYKRRFPSYEIDEEPDEPLSALIEELREKRKRRLALEGLQETVSLFEDRKTDESLQAMQRLLAVISTEVAHSSVVSSHAFISGLVNDIVNRKQMTLLGLPTGFPTIDAATGGLQPEQLVTLAGLPKSFKSSIVSAVGLAVQRYGKRVGIVSFEMSTREMEERYISMGAEVDLNKIQRGGLTEQDKEKIYEFEAEITDSEGSLIIVHDITSSTTVGQLAALNEQHQFDLLIVDGAYLMEDEQGEPPGSPRALTNITRSSKRLAQRGQLPILMSTQALYSRTTKAKGVQGDSIGYTSSFVQDSDVILGTNRPDLELPRGTLTVVMARNALGTKADIIADYNLGLIREEGVGFMQQRVGIGDGE